jgi:hypothetical protein
MNRIIYKNPDNTVAIIMPVQEVLDAVGIEAIAEKDVPQGLPYWFADAADIPSDRTFRTAWEVDPALGEPDGFGGESNEFTDEQLSALYREEVIESEPEGIKE